jgi:hypothetical protein
MVRLFLLICEALPDLGHPDQRGAGWASRDRAGGDEALLCEPAIQKTPPWTQRRRVPQRDSSVLSAPQGRQRDSSARSREAKMRNLDQYEKGDYVALRWLVREASRAVSQSVCFAVEPPTRD